MSTDNLDSIYHWLMIAAVAPIGFIAGRMSVGETTAGLRQRDNRASRARSPSTLDDAARAEIHAIVANGHMISAIKRYRELTGSGLKEAKDAAEAMQR